MSVAAEYLADLKGELRKLKRRFDAQGGRGVHLADEIDALERKIRKYAKKVKADPSTAETPYAKGSKAGARAEALVETRCLANTYDIRTVFVVVKRTYPDSGGGTVYVIRAFALDRNGLGVNSGVGPCIWLTRLFAKLGEYEVDVDGFVHVDDTGVVPAVLSQAAYGESDEIRHEVV